MKKIACYTTALFFNTPFPVYCGEADVVNAVASCNTQLICRFDVTVQHGDSGWDHFADKWDIISTEGKVLGTRVLAHPHETEQPFTRSLPGVAIPEHATEVRIVAHDSVHGYGGKELTVTLSHGGKP